MENSILVTIRKLVGVPDGDTSYDLDLVTHINTTMMLLQQLGVGPRDGFSIENDQQTWTEFLTTEHNLSAVKTYIGSKVRLIFDPPQSSFAVEALKKACEELEWRLIAQTELSSLGPSSET